MSGYTYTIEVLVNGEFIFVEGLSAESAYAQQEALVAEWSAAGYVLNDLTGYWELEGVGYNEVGVYVEADEEVDSPWSEYEQGWRNIRADERAAVERQNQEDALAEAALGYVPSYMGVRGSAEYDEEGNFCGYIYEP